jgi:nucleoside-diphosphate-sugar epimerase
MKALVTGAGGFLGARVVAALLEHGHAVRAVLRPAGGAPPAEWRNRAEVVRADLRAGAGLESLFDGVDVLVHLAAVVRGTPEAQFVGTVVATERLLEAMKSVATTKRVVLASSCSVYGWSRAGRLLSEDSPLEDSPYERDGYTVAKIWQERIVRRFADENGWALTVLRPGFIYGPGAVAAGGAGIDLGRLFLVVAPFARLRLTHVDNCAAAFAAAAEKEGAVGAFNLIDEERVSAWRYAAKLLAGKPAWRVPVPYVAGLATAYLAALTSRIFFPPRGGKLPGFLKPRHYMARFKPVGYDSRRAREALDWQPQARFSSEAEIT